MKENGEDVSSMEAELTFSLMGMSTLGITKVENPKDLDNTSGKMVVRMLVNSNMG
jgi:hypothetical protein